MSSTSACAQFDFLSISTETHPGFAALGIIIGICFGFILAFLLLWIICFHRKFKPHCHTCFLNKIYCSRIDYSCDKKCTTSFDCLDRFGRKVEDADRHSTASHELIQLQRGDSKKAGPTGKDQAKDEVQVELRLGLEFAADLDRFPMIDAITQVTEQDGEQELLRQDWLATGQQERDLWQSRLLGLWQLAGALINRLASAGVIDEETRRRLLREHTDHLAEAKARVEADLAEERRRRGVGESKSTSTGGEEAEAATEAEESRMASAMDAAAQTELSRLRRQLSSLPNLPAEQAEALVARLRTGVAQLENQLANQRLRQCSKTDEAMARRRQLLAQQKAADEEAAYGMEQLLESRRLQLASLVRDRKMSESDRQRLLAGYQKSLLKQKEAFEKSYLTQRKALAERLGKTRNSQTRDQEQQLAAELSRLTSRVEAGTVTDPERALDEFARLLESRAAQRSVLQEELDSRDCRLLAVLRDDLVQEKQKAEAQTEEELGRQLGLPEEDVGRLMDQHMRQVDKLNKEKRNAQLRSQRKLAEKLAQRQAKFADAQVAREAELLEVKRGRDLLLGKALNLQLDMDEQARNQVVEEHERQMLALGNSLQMSRLRQEKGLEAKLAKRRAAMGRMQRDTREAKLALDEARLAGEGGKLDAKLAAQLEAEKRKLEAESRDGRQRLRDRLAAETDAALKAQEKLLGEAIGRLQTGQARRRGVIDSQAKVLEQLESELEARLTSGRGGKGGGDTRGLDQILQSHRNQVANLTEQMDREKRQQEMLLKERLERRKLEREDEVKQTVDKEEQEAAKALDETGHGNITRFVLEMSLDAKYRNSMMSMEEEMRLEMKRQLEQLDREMEADLQQQLEDHRKRLFCELAKLTNIPKSEMQDMVDRASDNAGVGRRLARQVSKDITEGVRRMKREEAEDAPPGDGRKDSRRPNSSRKSTGSRSRDKTGDNFDN